MTRKSPLSGALQIRSPKPTEVHFSTDSDLERRRARRIAIKLMAELRRLMAAYDAGELEFSEFACSADLVTAAMADIALSGKLVAA